jgi:hypothetical protein
LAQGLLKCAENKPENQSAGAEKIRKSGDLSPDFLV